MKIPHPGHFSLISATFEKALRLFTFSEEQQNPLIARPYLAPNTQKMLKLRGDRSILFGSYMEKVC